jgi:radical SAM protein with 4Fe4S-binding SPASM domain
MKKIIFGTGLWGKYALKEFGKSNIDYFVDNNPQKVGGCIDGIRIINVKELEKVYSQEEYEVIIAIKNGKEDVARQMEDLNINNYHYYMEDSRAYFPTSELIVNQYEEKTYAGGVLGYQHDINSRIKSIDDEVGRLNENQKLFNHIEIETINRCNGGCSFCPVNRMNDPREYRKMSEELFYKIIKELEDISYDGKIALFSNNEPFLDERIIDFQKYAKLHLPKARFHMFTNGTLLTLEKFVEIIPYLDELVIDNYNQSLELIPNSKEIVRYCEEHEELRNKVTVLLRKIDEVLTTRGGEAPNARDVSYPEAKCVLPFKQMIIRPDGKVSLCCNDPLGRNTLADINNETLVEAWNNKEFSMVRKALNGGRKYLKQCEHCDTFLLG